MIDTIHNIYILMGILIYGWCLPHHLTLSAKQSRTGWDRGVDAIIEVHIWPFRLWQLVKGKIAFGAFVAFSMDNEENDYFEICNRQEALDTAHRLSAHPAVKCWGTAYIVDGSEPQWVDQSLL